jgi:hypothetical protein
VTFNKLLALPATAVENPHGKPEAGAGAGSPRAGETDLLGEVIERDLFGNQIRRASKKRDL